MQEEKYTQQELFEFDERKTIKGYPELRWTGKRPYKSTQYYPAQLKEVYGNPDKNGWLNKIFWGDNLQVMSHLLKEFRGKIDLIYIDPPFDSKADYKMKIKTKKYGETTNDSNVFEEKQYGDIWTNDEYLQFMFERIVLLKELLSSTGTIVLHCDYRKASHLKLILDEVFGEDKFVNEIIWENQGSWINPTNYFPRRHNNLFIYSKSSDFKFKPINDDDISVGINYNRWYDYIENNRIYGRKAPFHDKRFEPYVNKFIKTTGREPLADDIIVEFKGSLVGSVWYIKVVDPKSPENLEYPTQKPEFLLERLINSLTEEKDLVFDCFMGSGTTQAVSLKMNRRFLGADINLGSIQTTTKRLYNILKSANNLLKQEKIGFEVYNVNNYDFFRNPVEARELLIEALGIQPFSQRKVFDGELDGRNVKIMPINRISTKADLKELIANLPYTVYDKKKEENPNSPVDHITLVCMGHEPDLTAAFKQEVSAYKIDVEIVDILTDKKDFEFKREAQAEIKLINKELVIESFYPMNLMQKLSLQKEHVDNYKQLVESIMIDWNYDGQTLRPTVIDIPDKNEYVKGKYSIPVSHGKIKVKITDLLSESLEIEVK